MLHVINQTLNAFLTLDGKTLRRCKRTQEDLCRGSEVQEAGIMNGGERR